MADKCLGWLGLFLAISDFEIDLRRAYRSRSRYRWELRELEVLLRLVNARLHGEYVGPFRIFLARFEHVVGQVGL